MECTSRRFVITAEILLDLWRRDIHDDPQWPRKCWKNFNFFFFFSFEIDNGNRIYFLNHKEIPWSVLYLFLLVFDSSFTLYRKSEFFLQDFEIRFLIFLGDSGKWKSIIFLTWNFTFKRSSVFRGHAKYVSSVIASHLLN